MTLDTMSMVLCHERAWLMDSGTEQIPPVRVSDNVVAILYRSGIAVLAYLTWAI